MTPQIDQDNNVEEPANAVQGSPEPEISKHDFKRRTPLIYKLLGVLVVIVVVGYVGLKLYGMYKAVSGEDKPVITSPETGVTSSKRRVDLGQNKQFFENEPEAPTPVDTGNAAPSNPSNPPVAELGFKKYLSIPAQNGSGSDRVSTGTPSYGASEPVSEPAPASSAPQAVTDTKEVTGMKVESIAMDPNLYVEENTYIPCTLQTRFVSDVAGRISCVISEDVYSANSHVKLIEKGTKAFGVYRTGALKQGQGRMFVVWTQLRTRDFKKVTLVDTQVAGQLGESGIDGWVDDHFWERFKGALLLSTVQDVATAFAKRSGNQSQDTDYTQNTREGMAEMSNTALENSINIPPTMYKNQGDIIGILVGEDIDFSGVYAVRLKK
jgi:type IV secretion system protein VirB10